MSPIDLALQVRKLTGELSRAAGSLMREGCERCDVCNGRGGGYYGEDGTEWQCEECWGSGWIGPVLLRQKREMAE